MTASFLMREYPCPSGCRLKFDASSNAIHHAQQFHGYDRDAVERETGLTHYDKELWDMLPLTKTTSIEDEKGKL